MAEITPDSSLAEVISSLDLTSVPEKLHCSTCQGFLLNAYKTSCCEQNVCEKCFNAISDHCPMCKHRPFSKELCRPAKAMRNTVKAYLRSVEKNLVDERAKVQMDQVLAHEEGKQREVAVADAQAEANREVENGVLEQVPTKSEEPTRSSMTPANDIQPSIERVPTEDGYKREGHASPQIDDDRATRQTSIESDANDDEVEIQVEPDGVLEMPQNNEMEAEEEQQYDNGMMDNFKNGDNNMHNISNGIDADGFGMQNMNMMGFNGMGMDMNMMQQMMNMNPMMAMGMSPMFGGFGGSNGNMNGMNMMGMNFNSNQMFNGWNGKNSNMWQNNNAMNAMGDFGSQFGSNMSQQGNFYPQQFHNSDFNGYNGRYGRGRGRGGRGSYGRGRGSFNQYQQNSTYHNAHEQHQYEIQSMQAQMTQNANGKDENKQDRTNHKEEEPHDQDDFAPGGQDEVQEALGDDDREKSQADVSTPKDNIPESIEPSEPIELSSNKQEVPLEVEAKSNKAQITQDKIIPEAYHEDFESMAPPSAPTGPSGRYSDKEFAYRARGHGKYSSRGRGSFSASVGFPASPIRSVSQTSISAPSPPAKGVGVVGAPTGPRAMREPSTSKPPPRPVTSNGGFQIMGRASMQAQTSQVKEQDEPKPASPVSGYGEYENDKTPSRRHSKYEEYGDRGDADTDSNYEYERNDRDRDRTSKRSKRADYKSDHAMQDVDQDYESPDRKTSYRSSRHDKDRSRKDEKYSSSSKHRSSRRHYDGEMESDYDRDEHGESTNDRHRSSRSGKPSSKHESTRDRDRDSHRDRKRDRERDREREEERPKDKEDRHRKRSRHDRDREDEYDDPDDDESRHRSRRHKKEHHSSSRRDRDRDEDPDLGLRISGRSNSNRQSALPTPTSTTSSVPPMSFGDSEKDPHTLEREARNRERMLKEQQRREKAALEKRGSTTGTKSNRITTSGGRRVSYKYEDEVERGMGAEDEREKARWR